MCARPGGTGRTRFLNLTNFHFYIIQEKILRNGPSPFPLLLPQVKHGNDGENGAGAEQERRHQKHASQPDGDAHARKAHNSKQ